MLIHSIILEKKGYINSFLYEFVKKNHIRSFTPYDYCKESKQEVLYIDKNKQIFCKFEQML